MIPRVIMRKDENKAFSIDVNAYFINPTTHTISISRSEDAKVSISRKRKELKLYLNYHPTNCEAGDPQYEIAKLMYQDPTNKNLINNI